MSIDDFDPSMFRMGKLCKRGHDWNSTGQTLFKIKRRCCPLCEKDYCDENKEKLRERRKEYYQKNKERITESQKKYAEQKPEVGREAKKRYKLRHKEKVNQQSREYEQRRKEKGFEPTPEQRQRARERAKQWYRNNLERHRIYTQSWRQSDKGKLLKINYSNKYRARKLTNHSAKYSAKELTELRAKFNNCCAYCNDTDAIAIDHFIPISKGGADVLGNLIPSCKSCNSSKRSSDAKMWYESQMFYCKTNWKKIVKHLGSVTQGQMPLF